jgi:hypothetical protein
MITTLKSALDDLPSIFSRTTAENPFVPRTALNYLASVACAVLLLEHSNWSQSNAQVSQDVDTDAFRRWVEDGELLDARREMERVLRLGSSVDARHDANRALLYGFARVKL